MRRPLANEKLLTGVWSSVLAFSVSRGAAVRVAGWWGICESDSMATFFATPEWSDILSSSFDHSVTPKRYSGRTPVDCSGGTIRY